MPKSASPTTASVSAAISARASNDCPSRQQSDVDVAWRTIAPAYDAIGSRWNSGWINRRCRWWYSPSLVRRLSPRSIFVAWMVGPLWNERWSVTNTPWTRSGWFSSHESAPGTRARTTSPSAARRSSSPSGSRRNARSVPSALSLRAPTADETISVATAITLPLRRLGSLAPLDRWTEQSFDPLDLLANAFRTGAARSRMCADRTDRVEELGAVRNTVRRPLLGREVAQRALVGLERRDEPADALVCLTEGDAARDECLCDVGREQAVGLRGAAHRVRVERQRGNAAGERGPRGLERVRGVEHRFLVLLQIAVVAERKPVKDRGYGDQVAEDTSGLRARQLRDIGVPLVRHHARAGRERIVDRHPAERFVREPSHVRCETRQMRGADRRAGEELLHDVAIAHGVDRVLEPCLEPQPPRRRVVVEPQCRRGHRAGAERRDARAPPPPSEPIEVANEGPRVREQMMPERHRLREPRVRRPRHDCLGVVAGVTHQRARTPLDHLPDPLLGIEQPEPQIRHHQIVSRAARMELAADLAEPPDHTALDRGMHVLVRGIERERPGADLVAHLAESLLDLSRLGGGEQPRILERSNVRDAGLDVVWREANVERETSPELRGLCSRRSGETPGPQRRIAGRTHPRRRTSPATGRTATTSSADRRRCNCPARTADGLRRRRVVASPRRTRRVPGAGGGTTDRRRRAPAISARRRA